MQVDGKVFKYGDHVDTDVIIPARYMNTANPQELAAHCMEDIDKEFVKKVVPGSVIVAGKNFGCGSSREHAPLAIKTSGIALIIAESFARIFYRNAINIGLPIIEHPAARKINADDEIAVDFVVGKIINRTQNKEYAIKPFPEFVQKIISAGGLVNFVAEKTGKSA